MQEPVSHVSLHESWPITGIDARHRGAGTESNAKLLAIAWQGYQQGYAYASTPLMRELDSVDRIVEAARVSYNQILANMGASYGEDWYDVYIHGWCVGYLAA